MLVDGLGAPAPQLLSAELTDYLFRVGGARRVKLGRVEVSESCADMICQRESVSGGTIVVGGLEPLDVEPAKSARRKHGRFRPGDMVLVRVEVVEYGACDLAFLVHQQLDGACELDVGNLPV